MKTKFVYGTLGAESIDQLIAIVSADNGAKLIGAAKTRLAERVQVDADGNEIALAKEDFIYAVGDGKDFPKEEVKEEVAETPVPMPETDLGMKFAMNRNLPKRDQTIARLKTVRLGSAQANDSLSATLEFELPNGKVLTGNGNTNLFKTMQQRGTAPFNLVEAKVDGKTYIVPSMPETGLPVKLTVEYRRAAAAGVVATNWVSRNGATIAVARKKNVNFVHTDKDGEYVLVEHTADAEVYVSMFQSRPAEGDWEAAKKDATSLNAATLNVDIMRLAGEAEAAKLAATAKAQADADSLAKKADLELAVDKAKAVKAVMAELNCTFAEALNIVNS